MTPGAASTVDRPWAAGTYAALLFVETVCTTSS